jgi:hypothetical protein
MGDGLWTRANPDKVPSLIDALRGGVEAARLNISGADPLGAV